MAQLFRAVAQRYSWRPCSVAHDARRQPNVTKDLAKEPGEGYGICDTDGYDQGENQEVGHGREPVVELAGAWSFLGRRMVASKKALQRPWTA